MRGAYLTEHSAVRLHRRVHRRTDHDVGHVLRSQVADADDVRSRLGGVSGLVIRHAHVNAKAVEAAALDPMGEAAVHDHPAAFPANLHRWQRLLARRHANRHVATGFGYDLDPRHGVANGDTPVFRKRGGRRRQQRDG